MTVQLIIDGQHITDVLAQVHALANATSSEVVPAKNAVGGTSTPKGSTASVPSTQAPAQSASTEAASAGGQTEKKLTREEQDAAVEEMVAAGEKDARYDLLTKGRQKAVDDGITEKEKAAAGGGTDDELDSMFEDSAPAKQEVIDGEAVRTMMAKVGKDADGNPIQDNLLKIRDILTRFVPKGQDVKVGNIPQEKFGEVYAELKKLAA